jgi:hypothetical protein
MLQFRVESNQHPIKKIPHSYPALLEYETRLTILIDNKIFFDEPDFPVLEFLRYAIEWKKNTDLTFKYSSLETEDNPLLSFLSENGMFRISSPWQRFQCHKLFHKKEIVDAISALLNDVVLN